MNQRTELAINRLIDEGLFFRVNKNKLARHFLNYVLKINVFKLKVEEVYRKVCEEYGYALEALPNEEEAFYQFVANNIMEIKEDKEPYQSFNHEIFLVMEDLRKINSMIQEYESKQRVEVIDRYEKKKYQYLVDKLNKAKDEICEYMTGKINSRVYKEIRDWDKTISFADYVNVNQILDSPYPFRNKKEEYEMSVFDGLNYKFKYMTLKEYKELKLLHSNNIIEFNARVDRYISTYEIGNKILSLIEENHVLSKRVMLKQAIEIYKEGRMELFCQITPLQIEGIIYDYCIELGVSPSDIERVSLGKKVEEIVTKDRNFKCHEYFKYDFIELRNTAAHGRLHDDVNYKDTANMLILDLMYLCEFVNSSNATVVNKMRNLSKRFEEMKREKPVGWEWSVDFIVLEFINEYREKSLPPFYDTTNEIIEIDRYAHSESFLDRIKLNLLCPAILSPEQIEDIKKFLVYLKKSKKSTEQLEAECICLLKRLSEIKNEQ
ncbi:hypothetical protein [Bacillus mycoides]|uniref:Uncharacterized protein n=1 Tax=Bacillus mycoides TaxID=1405 RepID=A0A1E8BBG9_BACMY|nr:hypothetical protein [Bacillus mycoides]OFD82687.1 hypothetical protein BWGOE8_12720 [Bacillus mycoides]OFD83071.1 hypothetical protein BWGOE9_12390 [Bacillus mycoides]OFD85502.1 hypothetical protein BWGOE10_12540 [Bacillus mycoides]